MDIQLLLLSLKPWR